MPEVERNFKFLNDRYIDNKGHIVVPKRDMESNGFECLDVVTSSWTNFDFLSPVVQRRRDGIAVTKFGCRDRGVIIDGVKPVWIWGTVGPTTFPRLAIITKVYESGGEGYVIAINVDPRRARRDIVALKQALLVE